MNKIQKLKLIFLLSTFYFLLSAPALAARLYFEPAGGEFPAGAPFEAVLKIDAEGEDINAIEGKIIFPADILEPEEIRDGNSVLNFWIKRPEAESGQIDFSGVIAGGYRGEKGLIFSMIFFPRKEGEGTVEIKSGRVLLNDGKGTPAELRITNYEFLIPTPGGVGTPTESVGVSNLFESDKIAPEDFKPEIAQSPEIFDGKWFLVFASQDKESGIERYEVMEKSQFGLGDKWEIAESPYLLKDQQLQAYIYVRAVDKAGNGKIAVIAPRNPLKWYENPWIWGIIIIGMIMACLILRYFRKWPKFKN